LSTGVRLDQMLWNTAGPGNQPDILSELEWSDVLSQQITLSGRATIGERIYAKGYVNYAVIQSGTLRDSDYAGDDRSWEYSRSYSETNGDQQWDILAGGGYAFQPKGESLFIAPLAGFSVHKQNYRITNGEQVISADLTPGDPTDNPPPVGPLPDQLNSMYRAQWTSLWAGCDVRYQFTPLSRNQPSMELGFGITYHFWADYDGEGEWNLRRDLNHPISFRHDANARGISLQADWLLRLSRSMHLSFNFNYSNWSCDSGEVTTYIVNGGSVTEEKSVLNTVEWESHSVMLGITHLF